jgi:hypothetical protein
MCPDCAALEASPYEGYLHPALDALLASPVKDRNRITDVIAYKCAACGCIWFVDPAQRNGDRLRWRLLARPV